MTNNRTIITRIQNKYDTAINWKDNNPILYDGEIGFESDTGNFKIGRNSKHWLELPYASVQSTNGGHIEDAVLYTNETPIVNSIGSIKPGQTFTNKTIQEMLDLILYPYIDIKLGATNSTSTIGIYDVLNLPTLKSVTLQIKKNSATNLQFSLWDITTTENPVQVWNTVSEVTKGTGDWDYIVFDGEDNIIDVTKTFEIRYSYLGENDKLISSGINNIPNISVGTFTIKFTDPSMKELKSNLGTSTLISKYNGQTEDITSIEVEMSSLNSVMANPDENKRNITKLELYKDGVRVDTALNVSTFPYIFTRIDKITTNTTYNVKAYFEKRTATSTIWNEVNSTEALSKTLTINFSHKKAKINSFTCTTTSTGTYSRLNPQYITTNSLKSIFTKYSDKITKLKVFKGNTDLDISSTVNNDYIKDEYDSNSSSITFNKAYNDGKAICDNLTLTAKAYNNDSLITLDSSNNTLALTFYSPFCYGFLNESDLDSKTVNDLIRNDIENLKAGEYKQSLPTVTLNGINYPCIDLTDIGTEVKVVLAFPIINGKKYTKVYDISTGFEYTDLFEVVDKTITFADEMTTQEYRIFMFKTPSQANRYYYRFE